MTTLQTGTKVLIEATVKDAFTSMARVKFKSGYTELICISDLTVCETAEVDTPAPQQIEVGDVVRTYKFKDSPKLSYYPIMDSYNGIDRIVKSIDSKSNTVQFNDSENWWPLSSCALIHKGSTPSFKAGQEVWKPEKGSDFEFYVLNHDKWIPCMCYDYLENGEVLGTRKSDGIWIVASLDRIRPIPAQPTVESELEELFNKLYERKISYPKAKIEALSIFNRHQKHSGGVEVSVPSDEEIIDVYMKTREGSTEKEVIATVRHFMTRKEQQG